MSLELVENCIWLDLDTGLYHYNDEAYCLSVGFVTLEKCREELEKYCKYLNSKEEKSND